MVYTYGKDCVIVIAISHRDETSFTTVHGRTAADRDLGERLAAILSAAGCEQEAAHEQARAA